MINIKKEYQEEVCKRIEQIGSNLLKSSITYLPQFAKTLIYFSAKFTLGAYIFFAIFSNILDGYTANAKMYYQKVQIKAENWVVGSLKENGFVYIYLKESCNKDIRAILIAYFHARNQTVVKKLNKICN